MLLRVKQAYLLWHQHYPLLPKTHRYTLGTKIDTYYIEIIEGITVATFLPKEEKLPWVRMAIRKLDTLKILMMILWETHSIDDKKYISISLPLEEIGKMLGGWNGQLAKQNSPAKAGEK